MVAIPFVEILSFIATGIPASGPSCPFESISLARKSALSFATEIKAFNLLFSILSRYSVTISSEESAWILSVSSLIDAIYIILGAFMKPSWFFGALESASSCDNDAAGTSSLKTLLTGIA